MSRVGFRGGGLFDNVEVHERPVRRDDAVAMRSMPRHGHMIQNTETERRGKSDGGQRE